MSERANREKPVLDIVIVDYCTGPFLRECLKTIEAYPPRSATLGSVVVVDNASSTPAASHVERIGLPLRLIRNVTNRGFAAACNQGAAICGADYLLFLNPDTRITKGTLDAPVEFMERPDNRSFGIVGVQLMDEESRVARTCSYHPRVSHFVNKALGIDRLSQGRFTSGMMLDWDHKESRPVDAVMGAFYFIRRSLYEMLGGFDERFFVYFEEADFGIRARQAGYRCYYLAEARAYHHGCGASDQVKAERLFYSLQSRIRYGYKHFGKVRATLLLVVTLFVEPLARIAFAAAHRSGNDLRETARGYGMLWRSLPDTLHPGFRSVSWEGEDSDMTGGEE